VVHRQQTTKLTMKRHFIILLSIMLVAGCSSDKAQYHMGSVGHLKPGASSAIRVGMTKAELLQIFGAPQLASAENGVETLYYVEELPWWNWKKIKISLQNGVVTSYGQERKDEK
jgi:outer membrane protein assembly factor BamE (lipoprotein component of BamABCDE complex)